jgi:hypothetical protein
MSELAPKYKRPDSSNSEDTILKNATLSTSSTGTVRRNAVRPPDADTGGQSAADGRVSDAERATASSAVRRQSLAPTGRQVGDCSCSGDEENDDAVLWFDETAARRALSACLDFHFFTFVY